MNYDVKNLILFNDLIFSLTKPESSTGTLMDTEQLAMFIDKNEKTNLSPNLKAYLTSPVFLGFGYYPDNELTLLKKEKNIFSRIQTGKYLFVQVKQEDEWTLQKPEELSDEVFKAAEALAMEALWQEINLVDEVFVRTLSESDGKVFQIIRGIKEKNP